ncbi:MAG: cell division protein FtsQ/DivIB, partial [Candidatus Omnitrophica bacterium]|nr:cell division protein FtsQ/DivIB [Candidatus Omnitrophota bacterium]
GIINFIQGKSLLNLDLEFIYNQLITKHPEYKSVMIRKIFPSTLVINVVKRYPFAQIRKDGFYLLDEEGVVLSNVSFIPYEDLIIVDMSNYNLGIRRGKVIKEERLLLAFDLIRALRKVGLIENYDIERIDANNLNEIYFLIGDIKVIVGKGNYEDKLFVLKNLLGNKLKNSSSLGYIDLRYSSFNENIYVGNK